MAVLEKATLQRLAVLHALSLWKKGAYGNLRVQKTLFFADKSNHPEWHLFTFKRWYLGQYSDETSDAMNSLESSGKLCVTFDGPAERIAATISKSTKHRLTEFFGAYFPDWKRSLQAAFRKWGYLANDTILKRAHEDHTYRQSQHGKIILESFPWQEVDFVGLGSEEAEFLGDLTDRRLHSTLKAKLRQAARRRIRNEDWRTLYFSQKAG